MSLFPHNTHTSKTVHNIFICFQIVNARRVGRPVAEGGKTGIDLGAMRSVATELARHKAEESVVLVGLVIIILSRTFLL